MCFRADERKNTRRALLVLPISTSFITQTKHTMMKHSGRSDLVFPRAILDAGHCGRLMDDDAFYSIAFI